MRWWSSRGKIPGIGFVPSLRYRTALRQSEADGIGATSLSFPLVLKHNWGIWEPARRRIAIRLGATSTTLGHTERRYQLIVDQKPRQCA